MLQHLIQNAIRRSVRLLLRGYQLFVSPLLGNHCRYYPSCSQYAIEAVDQHGVIRGVLLAVLRLSRCHPWHPGGVDPVPAVFSLWPSAAPHTDRPTCGPHRSAEPRDESRPDRFDSDLPHPDLPHRTFSHESGETANRPVPTHMKSRRPEHHG